MNDHASEPVAVHQFRRWVSRVSVFALIAAPANLVLAGLFQQDRVFRVGASIFMIVLAVVARRALASFDTNARAAIDTIERVFISLFASLLICSPYPLYSDPTLRSWLGVFMLALNLPVACGVFWFVRSKISEVRALATPSLST